MTDYKISELDPDDRDAFLDGDCPWCYRDLTPVFEGYEHVADECEFCGDRFE